jgi:phosphoribosylamine---glycine ligase
VIGARVRFLGIGDYCELSALYLRLLAEGHEVKVYIARPEARSTLAGLISKAKNWKDELSWIGNDGIIIFENTAEQRGELQDQLRADGFKVIGGSAFGDRLENDRAFAQDLLQRLGFPACPVHGFSDRHRAIEFVQQRPRRYVLKFNGVLDSFVGGLKDGRDVCAYLAGLSDEAAASFVLMDFVDGIEMGVGAYFNGNNFLKPSCLDWEHKRFFPGDLGELTGEMGTVVTYDRSATFQEKTLGRVEALLREGRYCGYVNLNTIVNEEGIWPLEFTCRFGYPGYAILDPLQDIGWGDLFRAMIDRSRDSFDTKPGFSVGIVMTTPPFPYSRPAVDEPIGLPILFDEDLTEDDLYHLHYGEVALAGNQLVTSGANGWTMVVTGVGPTIRDAQQSANSLAARVFIPRVRYRRDIGERLIAGGYERVGQLGLLD